MNDLVVLVADNNMQAVMHSMLSRHQALGIRSVTFRIYVHPRRDPGCMVDASSFLVALSTSFRYALVMFDHQGCGRENQPAQELATVVTRQLEENGWAGRAHTVVIAPELEIWVWNPSPHVAECLGWDIRHGELRDWLEHTHHWPPGQPKPVDPKAALEAVLKKVNRPRSSAIYAELADKVSLRGHKEEAFLSLTSVLRRWFSPI